MEVRTDNIRRERSRDDAVSRRITLPFPGLKFTHARRPSYMKIANRSRSLSLYARALFLALHPGTAELITVSDSSQPECVCVCVAAFKKPVPDHLLTPEAWKLRLI